MREIPRYFEEQIANMRAGLARGFSVPRATLVIIAGTCGSFGLPGEAGVAMLLAVDEVMDMARTMTNVIGNGLASVVIARWERVLETEPPREVSAP